MTLLKTASEKYKKWRADAPKRAKEKRTKAMKDLRTKLEFTKKRAEVAKAQAEIEASKTRIAKTKFKRPSAWKSISRGLSDVSSNVSRSNRIGFGLRVPPRTDMWGVPIKKAPVKPVRKRKTSKRKRRKK